MGNPISSLFSLIAGKLAAAGLIDAKRGQRIADLTWPRFLTMFARNFYRVADISMVGIAVGPAAIAGLAFASIYWGLANSFSLGLAGGTISQVSQRFGAERYQRLDLAVKQSLWIGIAIMIPFVIGYWLFAEPLIGLVGSDATTIKLGATYLRILSLALFFNVLNQAASRTLAGADDTWIAMSLRATGALMNVIFNAILIFGLGMGVQGAAIGTFLAEGLITACFVVGFASGRLPIIGTFPVTISLGGPYFDRDLTVQLLTISPPLIAQHLARTFVRFPLFAILAMFGPTVVAAFEVGRRIRALMGATGSGFKMAASGLVGQEIGRGDEAEAVGYGTDVTRFSIAVYVITALLVIVFARPLAGFFADNPSAIAQTVPFIRVAAVSFVAFGLSRTFSGILMAAGDNSWILYGQLVSQYLVLIPLTYLGTVTSLGIVAVFVALVAESGVRAAITGYRYVSGTWKRVGLTNRPSGADD
jgi:putative MATE family efflux protein